MTTAVIFRLVILLSTVLIAIALLADPTDIAIPTWATPLINLGGFGVLTYYLLVSIPKQRTEDQTDRAKRYEMWQGERTVILDSHVAERAQLLQTCREEVSKERQHAGELIAAERAMWADKYDRLASRLEENGKAIADKTHVIAQLGDSLRETNLALKADMVATQTVAQGMMSLLGEIKSSQMAAAERGGRRRADGPTPGGPT